MAETDDGVITGIALKNPAKLIGQDIFAVTQSSVRVAQLEQCLGERVKVKDVSINQSKALKTRMNCGLWSSGSTAT